ncbi:unnamed protein product [Pleuronectes platessa]|uniref:Uncharacterized protein n=1 Tax=Pleuronectes platessa TaxID=8262 RepID=A0A9N7UHJ7_PLEPL|nr:unnamed protein product [Pleuronectes platessa]
MLLDPRSMGDQSPVAVHGQDIVQVKTFSFHLGDPERLDLWVINMKRQNWILSLCSQHLSIDKRVTQTACTSGCPT